MKATALLAGAALAGGIVGYVIAASFERYLSRPWA